MKLLSRDHIFSNFFATKILFFLAFLVCVFSCSAVAQEDTLSNSTPAAPTKLQSRVFQTTMRAASSSVLVSGKISVHLWGVEEIASASPPFKLKGRTALANAIKDGKVECEIKKRDISGIFAQCENSDDLDLGLFMIQQGYVTVDREAVYGSVFEDVYVQAEMEAQNRNLGIWSEVSSEGGGSGSSDGSLLISLGFVLFLCIIGAFTALSIIIMRGFKQVIEAQKNNMDMMAKERKLKDKERSIVATMLDSELKANKSKIEAYLVVYEEMLSSLKDPEKPPKYKKAGDIVQMRPVLSRAIFDRNNDKLDVFGRRLSSELIHFYARIKTNPDYQNLEPEMELDEAIKIVEDAVGSARRMNDLADDLIQSFEESGVTRDRPQTMDD